MPMIFVSLSFLGILVNKSVIETEKLVKAFPHDYPEDYNFDPKDGRKLWESTKEYLANFQHVPNTTSSKDFQLSGWDDLKPPLLAGYPVLRPHYSCVEKDIKGGLKYAIALDYARTSKYYTEDTLGRSSSFDSSAFNSRLSQFKETLTNLGIWNESFGFYSTVISYT